MVRTFVLAALLSGAALLGCKGSAPQMDIPMYPGSSVGGGMPNQEGAGGTMYRARRRTPDGVNSVAAFYRKELAEGRGWRDAPGIGPAFGDGNLDVLRAGLGTATATPRDPSRTGGYVIVYEVDNVTYVDAYQWIPTPAK